MKVYRIAKRKYLTDLSGQGARLFGGRWNKVGHNMLYCSSQTSLCVLELLVHMDYQFFTKDFGTIELELPENAKIANVKPDILKKDWRHNPPLSFTQDYGTEWLLSQKSLILKVPSAILPNEYNYLLNPNHKDFNAIKLSKTFPLDIDSRVFEK